MHIHNLKAAGSTPALGSIPICLLFVIFLVHLGRFFHTTLPGTCVCNNYWKFTVAGDMVDEFGSKLSFITVDLEKSDGGQKTPLETF